MVDRPAVDRDIAKLNGIVQSDGESVLRADGDAERVDDAQAGRGRDLDVERLCADVIRAVEWNLVRDPPRAVRVDGFVESRKVSRAIRLVASRGRAAHSAGGLYDSARSSTAR